MYSWNIHVDRVDLPGLPGQDSTVLGSIPTPLNRGPKSICFEKQCEG